MDSGQHGHFDWSAAMRPYTQQAAGYSVRFDSCRPHPALHFFPLKCDWTSDLAEKETLHHLNKALLFSVTDADVVSVMDMQLYLVSLCESGLHGPKTEPPAGIRTTASPCSPPWYD